MPRNDAAAYALDDCYEDRDRLRADVERLRAENAALTAEVDALRWAAGVREVMECPNCARARADALEEAAQIAESDDHKLNPYSAFKAKRRISQAIRGALAPRAPQGENPGLGGAT